MNILKPPIPLFIVGPVSTLPQNEITNQDLINRTQAKVSPNVISFSSGIQKRYWVNDSDACSDLAIKAIRELFSKKQINSSSIKQLILATISGDYISPPTSPLIQHQLNLKDIGAFDLAAACAGYVAGLHASAAFATSITGDVLLVASEVRSKFLNPGDFGTTVLFGDGAAACLISQKKKEADFEFLASMLYTDGEVGNLVSIPAGGSRLPASQCSDPRQHFITTKENAALFVKAAEGMISCASKFMRELNIAVEDVDWLIPHQGNKHLITTVCQKLGIEQKKLVNVVSNTGNTSGASVGIGLASLRDNPNLKAGDKVLLVAAGAGGIAGCAFLKAL